MSDTEQAAAAAVAEEADVDVKEVSEESPEKEVEKKEKDEEDDEDKEHEDNDEEDEDEEEDEEKKEKKEKKKKKEKDDDEDEEDDEDEDEDEEDVDDEEKEKKKKKKKKKKEKKDDEDEDDEEEDDEEEDEEEGEEKPKKKKEKSEGDEDDDEEEEDDDDEEEEGEEKPKKKKKRRRKKEESPVRRKPPARAPPPTPPKTYYGQLDKTVWSERVTSSRVWEVDEEVEYTQEEAVPSVDLSSTPASSYSVSDTLGQGYFSTVVKASKGGAAPVALKVISKELAPSCAGAEADMAVLKLLDHPNIIKGVEACADDEKIFVALELCGGDWLQIASEDKAAYTEADVHRLGKQLLSALAHMHEKNVVHGDLAPENLLLAEKSGSSALKVAGFTNARVVSSAEPVHDQLIGNPGFQGPEVLMNQGFGKASDVWAAGCLLFFFVAGKAPFDDKNTMRMNMKIRQGKFEFAEGDWAGVSSSLQELIKKMLLPKPDERISAKDALGHAWTSGAPGSAALPNFRENAAKFGQ
eukprot:CAMPEP_0114611470 /NCGR_PEP_ID=MMETSP0168-20121206/4132_1 /TAXON_ID=95228 ORGANISM="Vannella sp., Strain DIVA3 517/6/12" /NCGR_SAMPLE_ID=MMETSP0168 /ASSEMBLY_ACC=CAM_ASM_000044 /LENGTH=522 /DNA_ID=CAMNT_0001822443 /DNA_START=1 /DNA_END=1569 /DNA_ORIENTATION=+